MKSSLSLHSFVVCNPKTFIETKCFRNNHISSKAISTIRNYPINKPFQKSCSQISFSKSWSPHVHFSTETQQNTKREKKEAPESAEENSKKDKREPKEDSKKESLKKGDEESKKEKKETPKKSEEEGKKEKKEAPKKAEESQKTPEVSKELPKIKTAPVDDNSPIDPKIQKLANDLAQLNMLEMLQFARVMSRILGVPYENILSMGAPQPVQVMQTTSVPSNAPAAEVKAAPAAAPAKEKTTWALRLVKMDEGTKYKVLKEIRALKPGMKIDESKKYIEDLPQILLEEAKPDELAKWEEKLKPAGAHLERV